MLTENDVTNILVNYLRQNRYLDVKGITTEERGVDITAVNSLGKLVLIEVKGETSARVSSKRYGLPFTGKQIASHVGSAILQTLVTMNKPEFKDCEFAMAFPLNHEILIRKFLPSLKILGIIVYLVSSQKVITL